MRTAVATAGCHRRTITRGPYGKWGRARDNRSQLQSRSRSVTCRRSCRVASGGAKPKAGTARAHPPCGGAIVVGDRSVGGVLVGFAVATCWAPLHSRRYRPAARDDRPYFMVSGTVVGNTASCGPEIASIPRRVLGAPLWVHVERARSEGSPCTHPVSACCGGCLAVPLLSPRTHRSDRLARDEGRPRVRRRTSCRLDLRGQLPASASAGDLVWTTCRRRDVRVRCPSTDLQDLRHALHRRRSPPRRRPAAAAAARHSRTRRSLLHGDRKGLGAAPSARRRR